VRGTRSSGADRRARVDANLVPGVRSRSGPARLGWRGRLGPPQHALEPGGAKGPRAGVVAALGFLAMLASSPGQSYWLSLFVDDMIAGTGLGRTGFSAVYAAATVCSAAMVLAVGAAFDRRGPSFTWAAVAIALAAGSMLMSVAAGAWVAFASFAMLRAFGQGSFPSVGTLLVARTFASWRGRALGVANLGSTLAAAALPPVAAVMLAALGWRQSFQVTALVVLLAVLPLALLVRWRRPRTRRDRPLDRGPYPVSGWSTA